ncbi:ribosomal protein S12 methylthiotransferase accessory factor [Saccharothrix carnea]|uniref:Ribosomal protein S12 methylthiotransferase accessory factor n=1 Tax=Saccharothrix carnea TaxID=1280637 RepID=A0A2P8I1F6_SACCR|nr:YcaO-like family protein [Saccharothrix carnea]PSL52299.1 ribosomal protein S12 methylthiotransferase accessory factor [Saccharothrix carnea]
MDADVLAAYGPAVRPRDGESRPVLAAALVPREDVRFRRAAGHVYVCSSEEPSLRLRTTSAGDEGVVDWRTLPEDVLSALAGRGLLVPADEPLRRHPSFRVGVGAAHVVGDEPFTASVATALTRAGVAVVPDLSARVPVVALALSASEDSVREAAAWAVREQGTAVVYAVTGARVRFVVLRPPHTACPLCLQRRVRATRPDPALSRFPMRVLLGASCDDGWPSSGAAAGLIAHHVVRALEVPPDPGRVLRVAELVELDLDSCERVVRPVLHLPFCPVCADATAGLGPPGPPDGSPSAVESWRRMRAAVDPLTGIVADIEVREPGDDDGGTTCAWNRGGTDTTWFSPVRASCVGGATKADPLEARVSALGEVLERYAAGVYDPSRFVRASLADLGPAAVDPRDLPLGSARDYETADGAFVPYEPDVVIDWVEATDLVGGDRRLVPAIAVHVPYRPPRHREQLLAPNSTGLAAGSTRAQAVRGGLLEVVERDAAAVFWYNRLAAPTLDTASLPAGPALVVLERLRARGVDVIAKDVTTDLGIPVVMAMGLLETPERPVALFGYRADPDPHACLHGALQELDHVFRMYWRSQSLGSAPAAVDVPRDIWDFATYYCHPRRLPALDFLREGPVRPLPDPAATHPSDAEAVTRLVERLAAAGYRPLAVDITPVDVAECGVTVVRAVVPGLQPVAFSTTFRRLGGPRLYQAPVRMGLRDRPLTEDEMNPEPLPMG